MALDDNLPIANWPVESGEYKVVQLEIYGKPYLRFPEYYNFNHGRILMELLGILDRSNLLFVGKGGTRLPALEGDGYIVRGMGSAQIDAENKQASFYGDSYDYEIPICQEHLKSIGQLVKDWNIKWF